MASDKGGKIEMSHWVGFLSPLFIDKYNDFILIDGTHKTNIYDLSMIVTTTVDSLGISAPVDFLLAPSENSTSIEDHLDHLRIDGIHLKCLHGDSSRSIVADEGSTLVKVASLISDYNHCLCSFQVHQLVVRVSSCLFLCGYTLCCLCNYILVTFKMSQKCLDLSAELKCEFLKTISFFLYESWVFVSVDAFNVKFIIFYSKFQYYPAVN